MPLTRRQFELGVDEEGEHWMRQVYQLLAGHRELAYSYDEIGQAVLGTPVPLEKMDKLGRSLAVLVRIGSVDKADVGGKDYYTFYQDFDTDTWEPDLGDYSI